MEQTENKTTFEFGPIQTKWLESLEAHPERQATSVLGFKNPDNTYKACCLGELGLIAGLCEWFSNKLIAKSNSQNLDVYLSEVYEEVGLYSENGNHKDNEYNQSLSFLNDNGKTWPQIAAIIRANPEDYFFKSI